MKYIFTLMFLITMLFNIAWADSHEQKAVEDASGLVVKIDMQEAVTSGVDSSAGEDLDVVVKGRLLALIEGILDKFGDSLNTEEKAEIMAVIGELRDPEDANGNNGVEGLHSINFDDTANDSAGEVIVEILAIVLIFGTPIMLVAGVLYAGYKKRRLMHDTITQYVSSGKDIPPEVLQSLQKEVLPKNNLHKGLVMVGVGLGIFICFTIIGSMNAAALGLIPLFIGLAQLLIWKLENK